MSGAASWRLSGLLIFVAGSASGAVLRVPGDHPGIQEAIDRASEGDTVLVGPGEYLVERPVTFRGKALAVRSEAGPEATVIRMSATPSDRRAATVVVFEQAEGTALPATLEGFTITGGKPDRDTEWIAHGGGILCRGSAPAIVRCNISGNLAGNGGGVAAIEGASPTLRECVISGNNTGGFGRQGKGGGVYCGGASATLISCRIESNWTPYYQDGGGVHAEDGGTVKLERCEVVGNTAAGISCFRGALEAEGCLVAGNRGDGVWLFLSRAELNSSILAGNLYHGLTASQDSRPSVKGCVLRDNLQGAVWLRWDSVALLEQCTVSGNVGPALSLEQGARLRLEGSIVWDNAGSSVESDSESEAFGSFSCIETAEPWPGEGNLHADPLFCGWGPRGEVHVDSSRSGPGDGTAADPYSSLAAALDFSLALSEGSPCRRATRDGTDLGAPAAPCGDPGVAGRLVRLASGSYPLAGLALTDRASLQGSGPGTVLEGTVLGLRSGAALRDLTVTGTEGGIRIERGEAPSLERVTVQAARYHALFCLPRSAPFVADCVFEECQWGITLIDASPVIERCRVSGINGQGIVAWGASAPVISDCLLIDNQQQGFVASGESRPTLIRCEISRNREFDIDSELGGGVTVKDSAAAILSGCTISSNRGTGVSCRNESSTTLLECTISGNMPQVTEGGGVSFFQGASGRLVNCLVTGNLGGAVRVAEGSNPVLVNCTIAHNQGGGVVCVGEGTPSFINSIVWEGPAEEPCGSAAATLLGIDPLFERPGTFDFTAAPEDYYQPPQFIVDAGDYRLRPGSPAIDRGLAEFAPAVDREGSRRPCGAGVDLGAYEAGGCGKGDRPFRRGEVNRDDRVDLSDPVAILSYLFLGELTGVGCEKAADADDSGALDLTDPISLLNHLFLGTPPPPPPAAACGTDPTPDGLGCESPSCL